MSAPTLFDHSEPTVLAELERVVKDMKDPRRSIWYNYALGKVLSEINQLKLAEIDKLKQAFAEGYIQTQSAESWVKKFSQGK